MTDSIHPLALFIPGLISEQRCCQLFRAQRYGSGGELPQFPAG
jgi:hypothetical protein